MVIVVGNILLLKTRVLDSLVTSQTSAYEDGTNVLDHPQRLRTFFSLDSASE